jgi:hypothetical protein
MGYNTTIMKQKKSLIFSLFILSFLLAASSVQADVFNDVHSSANGSDATSNVSITNDVNTDNQSSSRIDSQTHTDIYINTNGQVKEYHSDKPGSVSIQSDDGTSKVTVDNGDSAQSTKEGNLKTEKMKNATDDAHMKEKTKETQSNEFIKFIQKQIQKIKDFFQNLQF